VKTLREWTMARWQSLPVVPGGTMILKTAFGVAAAFIVGIGTALAAGPQVVAGPAVDTQCYVPWTAQTKFFQFP